MRAALALLLLVALPLAGFGLGLGCAGCRGAGSRASGGPAKSPEPLPRDTTGAFDGMRRAIQTGRVPRERDDAPRLRALNSVLANAGLALLRAPPPPDLKRAHSERFLEGRTVFGASLRQWVTVVVSGSDAEVLEAYDALVDAFWGWHDAAKGRAPERSV